MKLKGALIGLGNIATRGHVPAYAADGVRELFLVSENSTSYGKDLGDLRLLESLLPELAATLNDLRAEAAARHGAVTCDAATMPPYWVAAALARLQLGRLAKVLELLRTVDASGVRRVHAAGSSA